MTIERLKTSLMIPVLRKIPYNKSHAIIEALVQGGVTVAEITMETENAEEIIRESRRDFASDLLIGAGTVLSVEDCKKAIEAGAQFVVSPIINEEILLYATERNIPVIPGVFTPSEMFDAMNKGASMVKLFPASVLGPDFIKDVKGPLGQIPIMTTGGITLETAKTYLSAGAVAVGVGSALLKKEIIQSSDWNKLKQETKNWMTQIRIV